MENPSPDVTRIHPNTFGQVMWETSRCRNWHVKPSARTNQQIVDTEKFHLRLLLLKHPSNKLVQKTVNSIQFSHRRTKPRPTIYYESNKSSYNSRFNKLCIRFHNKHLRSLCFHQGANFAEIPDRSFTLFVPMLEEPMCSVTGRVSLVLPRSNY